jgi:hypothetical protein
VDRYASLCWGQRYVWLNHHQLPPEARRELNFTISIGPAAGSTIESLRLALDFLVRRHEGLRTTYHTDGEAGPIQRVHPPRSVPVVCYDTENYSASSLSGLVNDLTAAEFVLDEEWPIRACIISTGSVPKRIVLVTHHTAVDDWSLETLKREADELHISIMARRPAALPPVRHHPVDLARHEMSPEAAEIHRRSRDYWDRGLRHIPADLFGVRRVPGSAEPAALSASLSSPAALSAARSLATRHGVWPSIVYTATFTALLAAYTYSPVVFYRTFASNRDSSRHADVLTCMFQPVLVHVDCADNPSFAEVIRRTAVRCGEALDNSYCEYDEIMETISRRSVERGMGIRIAAAFNHLRYASKVRGGTRTIFNWNPSPRSWSLLDDDSYLRVSEWQDCVVATLNARPAVMAAADVERFLRGFETLLVAGADANDNARVSDIARLVGFDTRPIRENTAVIDNTPVEVQRIAECLHEHLGVRTAKVFNETAPTGDQQLTAYVVSGDPSLTPGDLRAHVLGRMYDLDQVRCPHRFVVCDRAPADVGCARSWVAQPAVAAGTGRQAPEVPPRDEAERLLCEAVLTVNKIDGLSMAQSYVMAGGRVMNIPRVQQIMRDQGWVGPSLYEIASARPLGTIAARYENMSLALNQLGG